MMILVLLIIHLASGDIPICTSNRMGDHPFCFPPDYNKDLIPPSDNSLQVHVDIYIFEVSKIDDIALTITFELYMDLMWEESRIIVNETSPLWGDSGTFMGSTNFVASMWLPDIQIYMCKQFKKREIVTDVAGLIIYKDRKVLYSVSTEVILACPMKFSAYPLDHQICKFMVGSYIHDDSQIYFTGSFGHEIANQRAQQYLIHCKDLDYNDTFIYHANRTFSQTGFQVVLTRRRTPVLLQVYLTTGLFVFVSWISFIVPPEVVPGRMALLVTLCLVLVNIFNSVTANAPKAEGLTAVEMWVVSCIIHVFGVLAEYAIILKLIQNYKRRESREKRREEKFSRQMALRLHQQTMQQQQPLTTSEPRPSSFGGEMREPLLGPETNRLRHRNHGGCKANCGHSHTQPRRCLVQCTGETSLVKEGYYQQQSEANLYNEETCLNREAMGNPRNGTNTAIALSNLQRPTPTTFDGVSTTIHSTSVTASSLTGSEAIAGGGGLLPRGLLSGLNRPLPATSSVPVTATAASPFLMGGQPQQDNHVVAGMGNNSAATEANMRLLKQLQKDLMTEKTKEVQEMVDRVAMYLFPMIFILFNLGYWPYYLIFHE